MQLTINALPQTMEQFSSMSRDLTRPENTCVMFLCALNMYVQNKDVGIEAMNLLRGPRPMNAYDIQFLRDRLRDKTYLPLAYFDAAEQLYPPSSLHHPGAL